MSCALVLVQLEDMETFRDQLVLRLRKAIGGLHFQVAERALCLWSWCVRSRLALLPIACCVAPLSLTHSLPHTHEPCSLISLSAVVLPPLILTHCISRSRPHHVHHASPYTSLHLTAFGGKAV